MLLPQIAAARRGKNRMTRDDVRRLVAAQPDEARKRPRPPRAAIQVATLPAPVAVAPSGNGHSAPEATTVIHIHDAPNGWRANPRYVYIGRANSRAGVPESKWHNPYSLRRESDREAVIAQFAEYLAGRADLLAALPELRGKVLVCWCAPKACHGDVLAALVNAPEDEAVLADVFRTHDRAASLEDAEPEYAPMRPAGQVATVTSCYGRQVVLEFAAAPDLREGQRVRVEVV